MLPSLPFLLSPIFCLLAALANLPLLFKLRFLLSLIFCLVAALCTLPFRLLPFARRDRSLLCLHFVEVGSVALHRSHGFKNRLNRRAKTQK